MTEDYLHYVWKFGLFNPVELQTVEKEPLQIQARGVHNYNAGPDFLEGRLILNGITWAGNIEIHIKTSDWDKHKHQYDSAYNNVILHVVYEHDKEIYNKNGEPIPVLELKKRLNHDAYFNYERFLATQNWIPCEKQLKDIAPVRLHAWLDRVLLSRMEKKSVLVLKELTETSGNWDEVFYRFLFRYFGMKVNGEAMFELAKRTPFKIIQKEGKSCFSLEGLLFGQAGMLNVKQNSNYYVQLREEYLYQKQKYNLVSMNGVEWRYSKLRPPNFPTIRIAQLAMLYSSNFKVFQLIRDKEPVALIKQVLQTEASSFWQNHYSFKKCTENAKCAVGDMLLDNLIINVIVPICFAYGKSISDYSYHDYAIEILKRIKPENNKIIRNWNTIGVLMDSAHDSQALLELNEAYCSRKKCLNCNLGVEILSKKL